MSRSNVPDADFDKFLSSSTPMHVIVKCDLCCQERSIDVAEENGWLLENKQDLCRACKDDQHRQELRREYGPAEVKVYDSVQLLAGIRMLQDILMRACGIYTDSPDRTDVLITAMKEALKICIELGKSEE